MRLHGLAPISHRPALAGATGQTGQTGLTGQIGQTGQTGQTGITGPSCAPTAGIAVRHALHK